MKEIKINIQGYEDGGLEFRDSFTLNEDEYDVLLNTLMNIGKGDVDKHPCSKCDYKEFTERILSLNSCQDCSHKNKCPMVPRCGEYCRINCFFYDKAEE